MDEVDAREKLELFLTTIKSRDVQKRMISILCKFVDLSFAVGSTFCPILGPIHSIIRMFYPNYDHEEAQKNFLSLKRMIIKIDSRMIEASLEDRWNHIKIRFLDDIETIEMAVQTTAFALKAQKQEFSNGWMEELMDQGKKLMISLNHLLDGLAFDKDRCELDDQILIVFYNYTGGDRKKVEKLCAYFDQLLLNGLASLCLYLTAKRGIDWCHEVISSLNCEQRLSWSVENMKMMLEKCDIECSSNIRKDAMRILRSDGEIDDLLLRISEKFFKKYYWMETFFVIYNPTKSEVRQKDFLVGKTVATSVPGVDECDGGTSDDDYVSSGEMAIELFQFSREECASLDYVDCYTRTGERRCAIFIFARRKREATGATETDKPRVVKLVEKSLHLMASPNSAYRSIKRELDAEQIPHWGLMVMRHASHLRGTRAKIHRSASNESGDVVWLARNKCTACVLLGDGDVDRRETPE